MSRNLKSVNLTVIGKILTAHDEIANMPIQPNGAEDQVGIAEVYPEFEEGLMDLDGFSHIILLYHFHGQQGYQLVVKPFMDDTEHGVFATRSPKRPGAIGMSVVRLLKTEGNKIYFEGADMLNETPLIDIKPFFRMFDNRPDAVSGWLEGKDEEHIKKVRSDNRFK
ncbi:tRNA (N6-threonylcarbamoyladenosine(37)-N6)-methyltransferase TrmO [Maribellus sp. YY47]|uniref:tRNA (N6-threonylcarbamoyladenosine(37)-N6)-methyltransferase TrmO n=1 Tax=Maribellus sp. YY47 TaxID=2929486 RepID=UPI002000FE26|nr:tRNA (N6-threonylcarbamoyladenosine(37)-N6)-methyltransferase TrmO [Maribellus sp. YY47]MCK3683442.1 tRNA (N6-threonylcarbamoyladenosine(37)-N6)-methyltransferase TrmO [Maribellus sp. YY47]